MDHFHYVHFYIFSIPNSSRHVETSYWTNECTDGLPTAPPACFNVVCATVNAQTIARDLDKKSTVARDKHLKNPSGSLEPVDTTILGPLKVMTKHDLNEEAS